MEGAPHRTASYVAQCAVCDEPATHACVLCDRPACEAHHAGGRACWDCLGRYGRRLNRALALAVLAVLQPVFALLALANGCWHALVGVGAAQVVVYPAIGLALSRRRFARRLPRGAQLSAAALREALPRRLAARQPDGCGQCAQQPRAQIALFGASAFLGLSQLMIWTVGNESTPPLVHGASAAAFAVLGVVGAALLLRVLERQTRMCPHPKHELLQVPRRS